MVDPLRRAREKMSTGYFTNAWVHYKRLERGRFPWPEQSGGEKTMTLSVRELEYLLGGSKLKLRFDRIDFTGRPVA